MTDVRTYLVPKAILVELTSDAGISGWGECSPDNPRVMEVFVHSGLKEWVVGQDSFDSERLWDVMFYRNHDSGPGGALTNAIAGIDCALWDLKGKLLGMPAHKLLGGAYRDRVRVYGSFGIGNVKKMPPDEAARKAAKFVERGFTAVKIRLQIRELNLTGGDFTTAGGIQANYIARWDGTTWSALGSGMDGQVTDLAVDSQGNLYAAGWLKRAGDMEAIGIARWDGSSWSALGNQTNMGGEIEIGKDGEVYATGMFFIPPDSNSSMQYIARWDGST